MAKKDRRSHDQKRKAKLAKEARRTRQETSPLAYTGNKYKSAEYVPLVFRTERAIHEVDVMTHKELTDREVRTALEQLILLLRQPQLPPPDERDEVVRVKGQEADLLIWNIRRNWEILSEEGEDDYGKDARIGVLRTLLGSINVWSSPSPHSRGYLQFLEGFMKKTGVSVQAFAPGGIPLEEPEEDEMLELGREWSDGNEEAAEEFRKLADQRIRSGETESVVDVCQQLIGEVGMDDKRLLAELSALSIHAQRSMQKRLTE